MNHFKDENGKLFSFDDGYEGPLITPNLTPITEAEFIALTAPAFEQVKEVELAKFRADRRAMFALIGDMGFIAVATEDIATRDALVALRQGLLDYPAWPAIVAATTPATLKSAMKARYKTLTDALPVSVKAMFKELAS